MENSKKADGYLQTKSVEDAWEQFAKGYIGHDNNITDAVWEDLKNVLKTRLGYDVEDSWREVFESKLQEVKQQIFDNQT
ncbi:MAG: hypothetical protein ABIH87_02770 [bacterium]